MSLQFHENALLKTIPSKLSVFNQLRFADGLRLNQVYPKPQSKPLLTEFGIHHRLDSFVLGFHLKIQMDAEK